MKSHPTLLCLALLVPLACAVSATAAPVAPKKKSVSKAIAPIAPPVTDPADYEAASQLFERATQIYSEATNVKFSYGSVIKVDDDTVTARGSLTFEAPARFRLEQTMMRDKTVFVYDGYALMMRENSDLPQRVMVRPNYSVWDELPDVSLPDPFLASFLAGENPFGDFVYDNTELKRLPDQTIDGAPCEGVSLVNATDDDSLAISAWFSRETGLPARVIVRTSGATVTSNYSQFELDGEIPAGTFALSMGETNAI